MKKILLAFFIIFIGITNAKASETFTRTFIGYYHYVDENGSWGDFELFKRNSDQRLAYCIEPGIPFNGNSSHEEFNLEEKDITKIFNISEDLLEEISLWIHFGYGYNNHKETSWYVATQYKIWELLGRKASFTSENEPSNPWKYQIEVPEEIKNHIREIEKLISKHKEKPSITNKNIEIPLGKTNIIQDNILNEYYLKNNNSNVILENDILTIHTPKEIVQEEIILERQKDYWPYYQLLYFNQKEQNLLTIGNSKKESVKFSYHTISGKIKILKLDHDTKKCLKNMDNAVYGLYTSDGKLLEELIINNCEATKENLSIGSYYVKEIRAPEGYELDAKKYEFEINENNIKEQKTITVYEKKKLIPLEVIKYFTSESGNKLEENAVFEIIDLKNNKKIASLTTDKKGTAHTMLPYGTYKIIQIKGKENYKFTENEQFIIENNKPIQFTFINEAYKKKIKVIKFEKDSKKKIKLENIKFKIFDKINKKYICETKDCTYSTNKDGEFVTKELFPSIYQLEEVKSEFNTLLWNPEKIDFEIIKNSPDIIEIPFYNEKKLGELLITKTNEENNPLNNVEFEIYAKENIYDVDNTLIYKQFEKITTLKTSEDGLAKITLPLGIYMVKEIKTNENYILNENPIEVKIENNSSQKIQINNVNIKNFKIPKTKKEKKSIIPLLIIGGVILYDKKNKHNFNYFSSLTSN